MDCKFAKACRRLALHDSPLDEVDDSLNLEEEMLNLISRLSRERSK